MIASVAAMDASPVFVGRVAEMAVLDRNLARAGDGQSSVVLVGGEAGVGKTRLVTEFAARVGDRAIVVEGRCFPAHGHALPYGPFADLFRDLTRQVSPAEADVILGSARHELGRIVFESDRRRAPAVEGDLEARLASRVRTFELVLSVAERLQRSKTAVVVVEDLHWADQASLDLLGFLARTMRQARVLLLLTVRTDESRIDGRVAWAIGDLERTGLVERIELSRFSRSEVAAQIAGILHARPDAELVDRVLARSDGNAFFTEELLAAERRGESTGVPPLLEDLLRARLSAVAEPTRAVLRIAAVAGLEIDDELVSAASGLPHSAVATALRQAADRGLLVRRDRPPEAYAFRHSLLQQAVERELLPGELRRLHEACAHALERDADAGRHTGEIARHWWFADRPERALPAAVAAGLDAEERYAFADARRYYELALVLLDRIPHDSPVPGMDPLDLLAHAADVTALSGDPATAANLARRALGLIRARGTDLGPGTAPVDVRWPPSTGLFAGTFLEHLRWYLWQAGDYDAVEEVLEEASRLLPEEPPTPTRARLLGHIAGLHLQRGRLAEARTFAEQAVEASRATGALPELALALGVLGWCRAAFGRPDDGVADVRESLAIAELLTQPQGVALAVSNLAMLLLYVGRLREAGETARHAADQVRTAGLERTYGGSLAATAAAAAFALGDSHQARSLSASALEAVLPGAAAVWPVAVALRIAAATGDADLAGAARRLEEGSAGISSDRITLEWHRVAEAESALAVGDRPYAAELADAAIAALPGSVLDEPAGAAFALALRVAADRAELAYAADDVEEGAAYRSRAAELLADWRRRRESFGTGVPDPDTLEAFDALCSAEALRATGRPEPAAWEQATLAHERVGRPFVAGYARFRQAEAILLAAPHGTPGATREARAAATAELATAIRAAHELGAGPLVEEATSLARRARLDVTPHQAEPPAIAEEQRRAPDRTAEFVERRGLTPREVEVLALVAAGWSNREIAGALFISGKTASVHVSNILGKLGVGDRVEAAVRAQRAGLVGPDPPGSAAADED